MRLCAPSRGASPLGWLILAHAFRTPSRRFFAPIYGKTRREKRRHEKEENTNLLHKIQSLRVFTRPHHTPCRRINVGYLTPPITRSRKSFHPSPERCGADFARRFSPFEITNTAFETSNEAARIMEGNSTQKETFHATTFLSDGDRIASHGFGFSFDARLCGDPRHGHGPRDRGRGPERHRSGGRSDRQGLEARGA